MRTAFLVNYLNMKKHVVKNYQSIQEFTKEIQEIEKRNCRVGPIIMRNDTYKFGLEGEDLDKIIEDFSLKPES